MVDVHVVHLQIPINKRVFIFRNRKFCPSCYRVQKLPLYFLFVIRAFVRMREQLAANAAILKRLAEIYKTLLEPFVFLVAAV